MIPRIRTIEALPDCLLAVSFDDSSSTILSRGMTILAEQMGIVEAEMFIFLVKTEGFD